MKTKNYLSKALLAMALISGHWSIAQNDHPDFKSPCGMTSAQFEWPDANPNGYQNLDFFLTINKEAPQYFWAHQFSFKNGETGYMGLQTSAQFKDVETKVAIFSIWNAKNATNAPNGISASFGHEGSGYSCRIAYNWREGIPYRVRIWQLENAQSGDHWWGAWVMDLQTQKEEFIGKILVPGSWSGLNTTSLNFVEYWGMQDGARHYCSEIPYTSATFSFPSLNNGTIPPLHTSYEAYGACATVARIGAKSAQTYQALTGLGKK